MFAFKLWGRFGAFRDPLTITQNLTLPIPPKTTIGGILAAILGIDYNDYFKDDEFFNFQYSIVLKKPIIKRSYTQNYIKKYTERSQTKLLGFKEIIRNKIPSKKASMSLDNFFFTIKNEPNYKTATKPTFRELLINPEYLVIINSFKNESQIIQALMAHISSYQLYLGNTEFAGNYQYVPIKFEKANLSKIDSFTANPDNILFEEGKRYTPVYTATAVRDNRSYRDYKRIIICDKEITLKNEVEGYIVKTDKEIYNCEFV